MYSTPGKVLLLLFNCLNVDKEKEAVYVKALSANHFKDVRMLVLENQVQIST